MGAIFCQVIKIKFLFQEIFSIPLGNQKWKGEAPIFSIKVNIINIIGKLSVLILIIIKKLFIKKLML